MLRYAERSASRFGVPADRGRAERQASDVPFRRQQDGEIAAVAAADHPDPLGGDAGLPDQEIVGAQNVAEVLDASHPFELPPRSRMAAKIEGQASVAARH